MRRVTLRRAALDRGTFEGVVPKPPLGAYRAWVAAPAFTGETPTVHFDVDPPQRELEQIRLAKAELRAATRRTKGHYYPIEKADRLLKDLPPGRPVRIEPRPPVPLWSAWPVLLLFLALLTTEWLLRKRGGMV